jgi:hypothetical protein
MFVAAGTRFLTFQRPVVAARTRLVVCRSTRCVTFAGARQRHSSGFTPAPTHPSFTCIFQNLGAPGQHVTTRRWFSTTSPSDPNPNKSFMEIEKEIASLQREIRDLHGNGDYEGSLEGCQRALELSNNHFGEEHPVSASLLNNIALNQKYLGNLDEAVTTFSKALQVYEKCLGEKHTSCATCKINIAKLLQLQANNVPGLDKMQLLQEAKELAEEALVVKLDNLGENNPEVGTVMFSLGAIYNDLKMHDEAVETLLEVRLTSTCSCDLYAPASAGNGTCWLQRFLF